MEIDNISAQSLFFIAFHMFYTTTLGFHEIHTAFHAFHTFHTFRRPGQPGTNWLLWALQS